MTYGSPNTSLRFKDIVLRVAEYLGVADYSDGVAVVPTSVGDLDLCKRAANDGYRRFFNENPKWSFRKQELSLSLVSTAGPDNVDGDVGRYRMPWYFDGTVYRDWQFTGDSYVHAIRRTSVDEVQRYLSETSNTTGPPAICSFRRLPPTGSPESDRRGWEVIFAPKPSESMTVNVTIGCAATGIQGLEDFHFAGTTNDYAILCAAVAEAEANHDDQRGVKEANYREALRNAIEQDRLTAPRSVGFNLDRNGRVGSHHRHYTGVDTYNGEAITYTT